MSVETGPRPSADEDNGPYAGYAEPDERPPFASYATANWHRLHRPSYTSLAARKTGTFRTDPASRGSERTTSVGNGRWQLGRMAR